MFGSVIFALPLTRLLENLARQMVPIRGRSTERCRDFERFFAGLLRGTGAGSAAKCDAPGSEAGGVLASEPVAAAVGKLRALRRVHSRRPCQRRGFARFGAGHDRTILAGDLLIEGGRNEGGQFLLFEARTHAVGSTPPVAGSVTPTTYLRSQTATVGGTR